jgi:putative ABC transport system substrate-binding protein
LKRAGFCSRLRRDRNAHLVLQDAVTTQQRNQIITFAIEKRLRSMFQERGWAVAGGLMSYGENLPSMYRGTAYFVDRIFKGAKPADLPVEQATKFDMVINLRTGLRLWGARCNCRSRHSREALAVACTKNSIPPAK